MAFLELKGSFAKIRLSIGADGDRYVSGDATPSLVFGTGRSYRDDRPWIESLRCDWQLVAIGERFVLPDELVELAREKPQLIHSLVRLHGNLLTVFVATDRRGFDHFWRVFGNHVGDDNILMSIGISLDDYDRYLQSDKSMQIDLLAGKHLVSTASLGVHSRDFDPYIPGDA